MMSTKWRNARFYAREARFSKIILGSFEIDTIPIDEMTAILSETFARCAWDCMNFTSLYVSGIVAWPFLFFLVPPHPSFILYGIIATRIQYLEIVVSG